MSVDKSDDSFSFCQIVFFSSTVSADISFSKVSVVKIPCRIFQTYAA